METINENVGNLKQHAFNFMDYVYDYGPTLLLAIITLVLGLWIIRMTTRLVSRRLDKANVDASIKPFIKSVLSILLKVLLMISIMSMIGIKMTSFIAILTAATLAIGMAFTGTLSNFAGGIMIILFRPFKVGDYIEAQGYSGTVKEIQVFNTILTTPDKKTIIIPNGGLSTGSLINYSVEPQRRVDFTFGISYDDDIDLARKVLYRIIAKDQRILKEPGPFVAISELADSSVNFTVRVWVDAANYWPVFFDTNEKVKKEFDKEKISIPYPQVETHVYNKPE